jgi:hypothetical protein
MRRLSKKSRFLLFVAGGLVLIATVLANFGVMPWRQAESLGFLGLLFGALVYWRWRRL